MIDTYGMWNETATSAPYRMGRHCVHMADPEDDFTESKNIGFMKFYGGAAYAQKTYPGIA